MCVPDVYLVKGENKEIVFNEVERMFQEDEEIVFVNTAGDVYRSKALLRQINLVEHQILIQEKE